MAVSPEERRRIYEEARAKMDAEQKAVGQERTLTNLRLGVAGLLCYVGGWITGIIFLVLEQKNRFIRFHAAQSIVVFGFLNIVALLLTPIPFAGAFFGTVIGVLAFVLWLFLMIKASNEEMFKLPAAGDLADRLLGPAPSNQPATAAGTGSQQTSGSSQPGPAVVTDIPAKQAVVRNEHRGRAARVVGSAFVIAWSIALMIFLNFFHDYIAYYHQEIANGVTYWVRQPILNGDFHLWLPVLNTVLGFTIAAHIVMLAIDTYILRESLQLILDLFGIVSVGALLAIYPFNFQQFGDIAVGLDLSAHITLAVIILAMSIGVIVRFIKIIVNVVRGAATY